MRNEDIKSLYSVHGKIFETYKEAENYKKSLLDRNLSKIENELKELDTKDILSLDLFNNKELYSYELEDFYFDFGFRIILDNYNEDNNELVVTVNKRDSDDDFRSSYNNLTFKSTKELVDYIYLVHNEFEGIDNKIEQISDDLKEIGNKYLKNKK
jgi:hypothetical protein